MQCSVLLILRTVPKPPAPDMLASAANPRDCTPVPAADARAQAIVARNVRLGDRSAELQDLRDAQPRRFLSPFPFPQGLRGPVRGCQLNNIALCSTEIENIVDF
jgi:hypothetical protein